MRPSSSFFKEPTIVQRGSDILTVVEVADNSLITSKDISNIAAQQSKIPSYKPDGSGVTLVFHTENEVYVLGGVRSNPALEKALTKDGTSFPQQINSTIGGYLADSELPLKDAILDAIKGKMFLKTDLTKDAPGFEAQQILKNLIKVIETNEGWETRVCAHTDKWTKDNSTEGTMCYLTGIKHIQCSDADLNRINEALQITMNIKKSEGVNPRALSAFKFVPLKPIIVNSIATHSKDELTKATVAYENHKNEIAVTFNDLAIATLAKDGAFQSNQPPAQLALPNPNVIIQLSCA